jgi:thymidylate synthase
MKSYLDIVEHVLNNGTKRENRTGIDTISVFDAKFEHDMSEGFPLLTTKKINLKNILAEQLWMISGSTNVDRLRELTHGLASKAKTIWDDNYQNQGRDLGYTKGELGPVYGAQWRGFGEHYEITEHGNLSVTGKQVDQLKEVVNLIKTGPNSRRLLVSAWNPLALDKMALPPCHWAYEFYVEGNTLNLKWHQRSVDLFIGLPYNIAGYAFILSLVAHITGYKPGKLIGDLSNVHIYENHIEQCKLQLSREPRKLPTLSFNKSISSIDSIIYPSDFELIGYDPHPFIRGEMAI